MLFRILLALRFVCETALLSGEMANGRTPSLRMNTWKAGASGSFITRRNSRLLRWARLEWTEQLWHVEC
jgi:hypothetical protein